VYTDVEQDRIYGVIWLDWLSHLAEVNNIPGFRK
jgi:hypothetical protein